MNEKYSKQLEEDFKELMKLFKAKRLEMLEKRMMQNPLYAKLMAEQDVLYHEIRSHLPEEFQGKLGTYADNADNAKAMWGEDHYEYGFADRGMFALYAWGIRLDTMIEMMLN